MRVIKIEKSNRDSTTKHLCRKYSRIEGRRQTRRRTFETDHLMTAFYTSNFTISSRRTFAVLRTLRNSRLPFSAMASEFKSCGLASHAGLGLNEGEDLAEGDAVPCEAAYVKHGRSCWKDLRQSK